MSVLRKELRSLFEVKGLDIINFFEVVFIGGGGDSLFF